MNTAATTKRSVARRRRVCSRFAVGLSLCILVGPGFLVRPQAAIICDGDPVPVTLRASPSTINESGTTAAQLIFTLGGAVGYTTRLTSGSHDGIDAAQRGLVYDDPEACLQTTLSGPGPVTFWWRVPSEPDFDWLRLHIAGVMEQPIAGEVDWQTRPFSVPEGTHA